MISDRNFLHTHFIDPDLLNNTGIITDFQFIFRALGWVNAWQVNEDGCKKLTIEFLCTLELSASYCKFRMFNEEFSYTWKQFSALLGFDRSYELSIDKACESYDKKIFWKEIADNRTHQMPRTSNNHNPTLRFSH